MFYLKSYSGDKIDKLKEIEKTIRAMQNQVDKYIVGKSIDNVEGLLLELRNLRKGFSNEGHISEDYLVGRLDGLIESLSLVEVDLRIRKDMVDDSGTEDISKEPEEDEKFRKLQDYKSIVNYLSIYGMCDKDTLLTTFGFTLEYLEELMMITDKDLIVEQESNGCRYYTLESHYPKARFLGLLGSGMEIVLSDVNEKK